MVSYFESRGITFRVKAICLSILCATFLVSCSAKDLPSIADANQLVADSDALATDATAHSIPKDKWPASITALNPVSVSKDDNGINITTFAETGVGTCGYVVSHTKPVDNDHLTFSITQYPNIYRFDFKP
jgi:hypothetical protein